MMRPSNELPVVYLCREVVDFRKGINGLAVLVEEDLDQDPFSERLYCLLQPAPGPGTDSVLGEERILSVAEAIGEGSVSLALA
jgi:transposase